MVGTNHGCINGCIYRDALGYTTAGYSADSTIVPTLALLNILNIECAVLTVVSGL